MKMLKRVTVKKNERGLLLRNGDFERVLQPGTHWLLSTVSTHLRVEVFALEQAGVRPRSGRLPDGQGAAAWCAAEFVRVELTENPGGPAHRERRAGRGAGTGHPAPVLEGPGRRAVSR